MASPFTPPTIPGAQGYPLGLTGATSATRYVGATTSGAPASGTFAVGDFVIDQTGAAYVCTVAGSPGTWVQIGASAGGLTKISDSTLSGTAASFDLQSIAGTYIDLVISLVCRSDKAASTEDTLLMRFNNDSGANYDQVQTQVYAAGNYNAGTVVGSVTNPLAQTSFTQVADMPAASSVAGAHAEVEIIIRNYAATTFRKGMSSLAMAKLADSATNIRAWVSTGEWRSTAAITRVTLLPASGNFIAGSRCTLYGRG